MFFLSMSMSMSMSMTISLSLSLSMSMTMSLSLSLSESETEIYDFFRNYGCTDGDRVLPQPLPGTSIMYIVHSLTHMYIMYTH